MSRKRIQHHNIEEPELAAEFFYDSPDDQQDDPETMLLADQPLEVIAPDETAPVESDFASAEAKPLPERKAVHVVVLPKAAGSRYTVAIKQDDTGNTGYLLTGDRLAPGVNEIPAEVLETSMVAYQFTDEIAAALLSVSGIRRELYRNGIISKDLPADAEKRIAKVAAKIAQQFIKNFTQS